MPSLVFEPRFSASGFWASMRATGATVTYLLGAMVPILLARPAGERSARTACASRWRRACRRASSAEFRERTGVELLDGYGSTETNFVHRPPSPVRRAGGAMGRVASPASRRAWSMMTTIDLPDGDAGRAGAARATSPSPSPPAISACPEKTVEAWRNLWFHTGDRVVREADGYFRFVDRMKDAIRRRGENISSFEVEQVLLSHPEVAGAAVFPVRSELAEDEVMAAIVLQRRRALTTTVHWRASARRGMPYFAVPRFSSSWTTLPRPRTARCRSTSCASAA